MSDDTPPPNSPNPNQRPISPTSPDPVVLATDSCIGLLRTTKLTADHLTEVRNAVAEDLRYLHTRITDVSDVVSDRFEKAEKRLATLEGKFNGLSGVSPKRLTDTDLLTTPLTSHAGIPQVSDPLATPLAAPITTRRGNIPPPLILDTDSTPPVVEQLASGNGTPRPDDLNSQQPLATPVRRNSTKKKPPRQPTQSRFPSKSFVCYACGLEGHFAADCRRRQNQRRGQNNFRRPGPRQQNFNGPRQQNFNGSRQQNFNGPRQFPANDPVQRHQIPSNQQNSNRYVNSLAPVENPLVDQLRFELRAQQAQMDALVKRNSELAAAATSAPATRRINVLSPKVIDGNRKLLLTDQGYAVTFPQREKRHAEPEEEAMNINMTNFVTSNQLSAQLTANGLAVLEKSGSWFWHNFMAFCASTNSLSAATLSAVASNPTIAARKLTGKENIQAKFIGNGYLAIKTCTPLSPEAFEFVPFEGSCYSNPSIKVKLPTNTSITTFIDLNTMIITNRAYPVDCSLTTNFEYVINDTLISLNPFTLESKTSSNFHPQQVSGTSKFKISPLDEDPPIFHNLIIGSILEDIPEPHYDEIWEAMQGSPGATTRMMSKKGDPSSGPLAVDEVVEALSLWERFKVVAEACFVVWCVVCNIIVTVLVGIAIIGGVARFYIGPWLGSLRAKSETPAPTTSETLNVRRHSLTRVASPVFNAGLPTQDRRTITPVPIPDCTRSMKRLQSPIINVLSFTDSKYFTAQIPVRVNGISFWALVDTGAGFTVAGQDICPLIGVSRLNPPTVNHALGLGGNEVGMAGSATVKIEIGSYTIYQSTNFTTGQCCPEGVSNYDFIFGNDLLSRLPKFFLDYTNGYFEIGDEKLPLGIQNNGSIFPCRYDVHCSITPDNGRQKQKSAVEDEVELDPEFTIDLSHAKITDDERQILTDLLNEFPDAFSRNSYDLGSSKTEPVHIYTNTEVPVKARPYRVPVKYQAELEKHINSLLRSGRITESNTPWLSPIVLVKKKNGSLRVCLDFRKLNEATIPDNFPLPRIDAILERVGGSNYFSSLDMANGYLQLRLDPASSYKCGFITESKVYAYTHLPFGLKSAASYFQRALRTVLGGLEDEVLVYIDDILIFSKTFPEHINSIRKVLLRFRDFNLKASPKKCEFAKDFITFLGHEINRDNYAPDKANVAKIVEFPIPSNINEIRRFVGMAGFFRKFIQNFSEIAEPLTRLTRKEQKFVWNTEQQTAFERLRDALASEPILGYPDYDKPFHIFCDASAVAQGAALMQARPDNEKDFYAIAYASRTLSDPETRWPAIQVEMGAIIFALRQFRPYICLSKIILHSDHKPLTFLLQKSKTHDNLARWLIELQCYDITIVHIDGKKNTVADCLSRARENEDPAEHIELKDIVEFPVCMKIHPKPASARKMALTRRNQPTASLDIVQEQEKDPDILAIKNVLQNKSPIESLPESLTTRLALSTLAANGTVITKPFPTSKRDVLYVPKQLTELIFEAFHESFLSGGHFNWKKTAAKIGRKYFWPKMAKEILERSKACERCQAKNSPIPAYREKLLTVTTSRVFQKVGLDLTGPLRTTAKDNKYIMNIVCWFSKFVISVPLPDARADTAARALLTEVVLKYGAMSEIVTDNAKTFTCQAFDKFCESLSIQNHKSIPYWSKGNAATERTFRTFHQLTSKYVNKTHTDWDTFLPALTFCYNTTIHSTTGETPFFLMHGRDPIFSIDRIIDPLPEQNSDADPGEIEDFRQEMVTIIREAWNHAKEQADKARETFSTSYEPLVKPSIIKVGDRVLMKNYFSKKNLSRKLVLPWVGQYRVLEINRPEAIIQDISNPGKPPRRVHLDQIKKFWEISGPAATSTTEATEAVPDEEDVAPEPETLAPPAPDVAEPAQAEPEQAEPEEMSHDQEYHPFLVVVTITRINNPRPPESRTTYDVLVEIAPGSSLPGTRRFFRVHDSVLCQRLDEVIYVNNRSRTVYAALRAPRRRPRRDGSPLVCGCPGNQASRRRTHNDSLTCKAWQLAEFIATWIEDGNEVRRMRLPEHLTD
ncbi:hypothetical protein CAEBREN_03434 [Caenorhabditis brenneri]|uniref:RNA-directed DNA polymerase n=1 Tax=Caenorhabditis brenneri TaxID=135651 RepID=G0N651_CAEBE|nr:hypothetical protein CAEBREN_03434 [Caenorhabditis brenneri]